MVSSLTAAASVVLLISSATRASSFLKIKEKQFTDKKNGLPTKCPPYSLLDSSRQQLESAKVIGSLLVIIRRSLGLDPRQEPHTCNIHLSCSLRKLCHENY